jgi:MFS family permease
MPGHRIQPVLSRKGLIAVVIGNWLEFYDFLVFTFFAVMIADAFFPGESEIARLLGALATFGVGFLTRPIGAAIIGAYADRVGRRAALSFTLIFMSLGSALVALTPSYATIGLAAPIILLVARLIQGFSCGGEVGAATTYLLESAPMEKRATVTALQGHSQQLAIFMGSLIGVILATTLTRDQLYGWGWRIPFIIGMLIAPVGMYIRRELPETITVHEAHSSSSAVLSDLLRHHLRPVVFGILIISGATISTYVFAYMTTYAITTLRLSAAVGTMLVMTGSVAAIAGIATGAFLDRFGRQPVLIGSRVLFVIAIYPAYRIVTSAGATAQLLVIVNMLLNFLFSIGMGGVYAFLSEAFPKSVRSSGMGLLYNLGVLIFGGTTQFVIAWLIHATHDPMVPAWYQIAANILSIAGIVLLAPYAEFRIRLNSELQFGTEES